MIVTFKFSQPVELYFDSIFENFASFLLMGRFALAPFDSLRNGFSLSVENFFFEFLFLKSLLLVDNLRL